MNRWELQKSIPPVSGSTFEISISTGWQYEACATPTATLKHSAAGSTGRSRDETSLPVRTNCADS